MQRLRDYACECDRRSCRERVYLTVPDYREAAQRGRVVALEHVHSGEQIERHRTYAIVTQDRARVHRCARRAQAEREPHATTAAGVLSSAGLASTTPAPSGLSSRSAAPQLVTPGGTRV